MTVVQISLVSIFLDLIFDLLKRVLWRSLYVLTIWSFFLISTRKSITYTLLYILVRCWMNEYFQAVVSGWRKSIFAVAIILLIFNISFSHHRYLRAYLVNLDKYIHKDLKWPICFFVCILCWLQIHFSSRIFRVYAKFREIWRLTKVNVYKGRIALFDFQKTPWLLRILPNKDEYPLLLSKFRQSQAPLDACHNR